MPDRATAPEARRAFDEAARSVCELARHPQCPRLPDDAWNALLRGQRESDAHELTRYAGILRGCADRLGRVVPRG